MGKLQQQKSSLLCSPKNTHKKHNFEKQHRSQSIFFLFQPHHWIWMHAVSSVLPLTLHHKEGNERKNQTSESYHPLDKPPCMWINNSNVMQWRETSLRGILLYRQQSQHVFYHFLHVPGNTPRCTWPTVIKVTITNLNELRHSQWQDQKQDQKPSTVTKMCKSGEDTQRF